MSTPNNNWEVHWQETLAEHKASPPSANDWAGMEQLLDAKIVPVNAIQASNPGSSGAYITSSIPWPVWVIALVSLLALGYWLGSSSAGVIGYEERPLPAEQASADFIKSTPISITEGENLPSPEANSHQTAGSLTSKINRNNNPPKPGPAISTLTPAGGDKDGAPPAGLESFEETPKNTAAVSSSVGGTDSTQQMQAPPSYFPGYSPKKTERRVKRKYKSVSPLKTYTLPTEGELWERRIDLLIQSDQMIILPTTRFNNGHFPPYRKWD